jgi:hypothetical protein
MAMVIVRRECMSYDVPWRGPVTITVFRRKESRNKYETSE